MVGAIGEGKTIEFKRQMPAKARNEIIDFLAAVSSLANTAGGDLFIGVAAKDGVATEANGVAFESVDSEKLRLEQLLTTGIEPRVPRVEMEPVGCPNGRHALVV